MREYARGSFILSWLSRTGLSGVRRQAAFRRRVQMTFIDTPFALNFANKTRADSLWKKSVGILHQMSRTLVLSLQWQPIPVEIAVRRDMTWLLTLQFTVFSSDR